MDIGEQTFSQKVSKTESNYPNSYQELGPNKTLDALNDGSNFSSIGFAIGIKLKL